jgi:predicted DNA-binding transcriptional regulator AlpA
LCVDFVEEASMKSDAISYPPRGLSREEAARYIGVGSTLFDQMVADGRMPRPKSINSRAIWDRVALDIAFTSLPDKDSDLQDLLERSKRAGERRR